MTRRLRPKTMKLKGLIRGRNVNIVVDSSSTHNCINIDLAKQLDICICLVKDLTTSIATGKKFEEIGEFHKVSIHIQELHLQIDLFSLPLKEMDVVLGAKWLIQLGSYATNLEE